MLVLLASMHDGIIEFDIRLMLNTFDNDTDRCGFLCLIKLEEHNIKGNMILINWHSGIHYAICSSGQIIKSDPNGDGSVHYCLNILEKCNISVVNKKNSLFYYNQ